jgi:thiamine biosynthesis protein ThiS
MQVTINGEAKDLAGTLTLEALLRELKLTEGPVAVELNAHVIPKARQAETVLQAGDEIEIVTFVGGG